VKETKTMVYDKARSGDPDYDDKQPIEHHGGRLIKSADGRDVLITKATGPIDPYTGAHVNLDVDPDAGDNRPVPGEVAVEHSDVQTYVAEDTPAADRPADEATGTAPDPVAAADSTKTRARK
jgi:hypothetical protein